VPFRARERCWPAGLPPSMPYSLVEPYFFYQMKGQSRRHQPGRPGNPHDLSQSISFQERDSPSWYGESVGHYENGNTLVIDTIGISGKSFADYYRTPHTDQIPRDGSWTLSPDLNTSMSSFVEDPGASPTLDGHSTLRRAEGEIINRSPVTKITTINFTRLVHWPNQDADF